MPPPKPPPGRKPDRPVRAAHPTCHLCQWVYRLALAAWELKFVSAACLPHLALPASHEPL